MCFCSLDSWFKWNLLALCWKNTEVHVQTGRKTMGNGWILWQRHAQASGGRGIYGIMSPLATGRQADIWATSGFISKVSVQGGLSQELCHSHVFFPVTHLGTLQLGFNRARVDRLHLPRETAHFLCPGLGSSQEANLLVQEQDTCLM